MAKHQGFKVADEGDGLKVLFQCTRSEEALLSTIRAVEEAWTAMKGLESSLQIARLIPDSAKMDFRASVVWGGLNPIWKEVVGVRTAEWEDAKGMTSFKDAHRIMEFEKESNSVRETGSYIVVMTTFDLGEKFAHHECRLVNAKVRDVGEVELTVLNLRKRKETSSAA